jgi:HD superfamily phosphohydrolase YqeK
MNLFQKIIFLSDYIDESRTFPDCVRLRGVFWDAKPGDMNAEERGEHLDSTVLEALDLTISEILERGGVINPDTIGARNSLVMAREKKTHGGENE